jgi:hypothetical protein
MSDLREYADKSGQPYAQVGGDKPEGFVDLEQWCEHGAEGDCAPHGMFKTGNSAMWWEQPYRVWLRTPRNDYSVSVVPANWLDRYIVEVVE